MCVNNRLLKIKQEIEEYNGDFNIAVLVKFLLKTGLWTPERVNDIAYTIASRMMQYKFSCSLHKDILKYILLDFLSKIIDTVGENNFA